MKKIQLLCLASMLAIAGIAHAGVPCNGFEIKVINKSSDDLLVTKVSLDDAEIQPGSLEKIAAHSEQVFTVNNSTDGKKMNGTFDFHSISLPSKKVTLKFDLHNKDLVCYHNDNHSGGDYPVDKTRIPGKGVNYTIGS